MDFIIYHYKDFGIPKTFKSAYAEKNSLIFSLSKTGRILEHHLLLRNEDNFVLLFKEFYVFVTVL